LCQKIVHVFVQVLKEAVHATTGPPFDTPGSRG